MRITSPNETDGSPNIGDTGIPNTGKTLFQLLKQSYQKGFAASQESLSNKEFVPETIADTIPIKDNDAFYTKVSSRQTATVRTKDSTTTLLAKLLNLFIAIQDEKKKEKELKHNFAKEKTEKLLKQHIEIVEAFGGKSKFSKVEKKKRKGTGILGKLLLGSSLFALSDMVMTNTKDVTEKAKGFSGELGSGLEKLWTIAKDEIDKFEIIKNIEEFTAPMMNWLHDRLSSIFGETAVNMVFKKRPEQVDKLTAESAEMVSSLFPEISDFGPIGKGMAGNEASRHAMKFFQSKGWTKEQSAGIVGNLQLESQDFAPDVISGKRKGDGGLAVGVAQWHPDRQKDFEERYGHNLEGSSLDEQLDFVNYELTMGKEQKAGNILKEATLTRNAAQVVDMFYERSKGIHRKNRMDNASKLANESDTINQPEQLVSETNIGSGLDKASVENKDIKKINKQDNNTVIVNNNNFQYLNPTTKNTSIMYKQNDNSQLSNWSIN